MTKRSDLMCEDIFGCDHKPETPIVLDGEIIEYRCRCGQRRIAMKESTCTIVTNFPREVK